MPDDSGYGTALVAAALPIDDPIDWTAIEDQGNKLSEQAYEATPGLTGTTLDKQEQKLFGTNYEFYDMGSAKFEDKTQSQGR